jgi:hypothetical protein
MARPLENEVRVVMEAKEPVVLEHSSIGTVLWCHPDNVQIAFVWILASRYANDGHQAMDVVLVYPACVFPHLVICRLEMFDYQSLPGC